YRRALAAGRIREADLEEILAADAGDTGAHAVAGLVGRLELRRALTLYGIPDARGEALPWRLSQAEGLGAMWEACVHGVQRAEAPPRQAERTPRRHRDLLLAATTIDVDAW